MANITVANITMANITMNLDELVRNGTPQQLAAAMSTQSRELLLAVVRARRNDLLHMAIPPEGAHKRLDMLEEAFMIAAATDSYALGMLRTKIVGGTEFYSRAFAAAAGAARYECMCDLARWHHAIDPKPAFLAAARAGHVDVAYMLALRFRGHVPDFDAAIAVAEEGGHPKCRELLVRLKEMYGKPDEGAAAIAQAATSQAGARQTAAEQATKTPEPERRDHSPKRVKTSP